MGENKSLKISLILNEICVFIIYESKKTEQSSSVLAGKFIQ
ncbi:hypothetical protein L291_1320 [Acinetobacter guillouiae MSP4-18]|nr:hypothetical protein L291_1320 [Acinetobacter guillouiae MSP4-18]BAP38548.1 hypothetical protein AS4_36080 [Acinetobacter guillouiae]